MGIFSKKDELSGAHYRALVCCAIPIAANLGTKDLLLPYPKIKPEFAAKTLESWDVKDGTTAIAAMESFCSAQAHNPIVSEIFDNIIQKNQYEIIRGIFTPIKQNDLLGLNLAQNFIKLWKSITNNANEDIEAFTDYLANPAENITFHNITQSVVLNRINTGVAGYERTIRSLIVFGCSMDEITKITNFCAWDLGRTGFVAKMSVAAGFIDSDTAWKYMLKAGDDAYKTYISWRQFLAAYFLGRGMALTQKEQEIGEFGDIIGYLLKHKKSPYRISPLKFQ